MTAQPSFHPAKTRKGIPDGITIGILELPKIVSFVERIRAREGIVPPETRRELKENLRLHPPTKFEPEARVRVERVLILESARGMGLPRGGLPSVEALPQEAQAAAEAIGQTTCDASGLGHLLGHLPGVVARYIVAGLMEVPSASLVGGGGVQTTTQGGERMVIAAATSATDLDDLVRLLREQWRAEFLTGQRDRGPDTLTMGLWLRHCRRVLERSGDAEGISYRRLSELGFAIWPETRPRGEPLEPGYERALERQASRARDAMDAAQKWVDDLHGAPDQPPGEGPGT